MAKSIRDYISASQLKRFIECPIQYKKQYVDGQKLDFGIFEIYVNFGSSLHHALEMQFEQKITSRKDLSDKKVVDIFMEHFMRTNLSTRCRTSEKQKLRDVGSAILVKFMKDLAPWLMPAYTEYEFNFELESVPVTLYGKIDMITEDGVLIDWKSCSKNTAGEFVKSKVDNDVQFTMYALAYRKMFNKPEKHIRVQMLQRTDSGVILPHTVSHRSDDDIYALIHMIEIFEKMVANDLFYPNYKHCSTCNFKKDCKKSIFL